jgi:hypothetical protein
VCTAQITLAEAVVSGVWLWGPVEGDTPLCHVIYKSITFSRFVACPLMDMALMCVSVIELAVLRLLSEDLLKFTARRCGGRVNISVLFKIFDTHFSY